MKVIIVEDEKHARENLAKQLLEIDETIEIQTKLDSVKKTVEWLGLNKTDLIFLDIHLADDLSFRIFDQINVLTPIIFTTAYDKYALKAFKVNSIDYLLKPIDKSELAASIQQFKKTHRSPTFDYQQLVKSFNEQKKDYQKRFIVSRRDKILSIKIDEIAYFEGEDRYVYLVKKDGSRYIINYKLAQLESMLDPELFFRLNRSFIAHFEGIENIENASKSRVSVHLNPPAKRSIVVSFANSRDFKKWLDK